MPARRRVILSRSFYARPAELVARELLGCTLVHRVIDEISAIAETFRARIVETEAYVGPHDLACHASKGCTPRTQVMFGEAGHAYVYFIYGMHFMLNIVTGKVDDAQAVLIRAAEPLDGWTDGEFPNLTGPGRMAKGMAITRQQNGVDMVGTRSAPPSLFCEHGTPHTSRILVGPRVGVDYAEEWAHAPLRFALEESRAVSKPVMQWNEHT